MKMHGGHGEGKGNGRGQTLAQHIGRTAPPAQQGADAHQQQDAEEDRAIDLVEIGGADRDFGVGHALGNDGEEGAEEGGKGRHHETAR